MVFIPKTFKVSMLGIIKVEANANLAQEWKLTLSPKDLYLETGMSVI